ncbi:MAG: hypothetical protein ACR2QM_02445 [Longimicrobiales bacterium]
MRDFADEEGRTWRASVAEEPGGNYKGRFYLQVALDGGEGEAIALPEIRWNSIRTADRTLNTMSVVELRRRLRTAMGRQHT